MNRMNIFLGFSAIYFSPKYLLIRNIFGKSEQSTEIFYQKFFDGFRYDFILSNAICKVFFYFGDDKSLKKVGQMVPRSSTHAL